MRFHVREGLCFEKGKDNSVTVSKYNDARCEGAPIFAEKMSHAVWASVISHMAGKSKNNELIQSNPIKVAAIAKDKHERGEEVVIEDIEKTVETGTPVVITVPDETPIVETTSSGKTLEEIDAELKASLGLPPNA